MNPHESPLASASASNEPVECTRRLDMALIAAILIALFVAHFISLVYPSLRNWFMPRFGTVSPLSSFSFLFLLLYLYRPSYYQLKAAAFMLFVAAILSSIRIAWWGTVPVVTNPFIHILPSAYLWSVLPLSLMGMYVSWIAWIHRSYSTARSVSTIDSSIHEIDDKS
jgi:hypothetical protein